MKEIVLILAAAAASVGIVSGISAYKAGTTAEDLLSDKTPVSETAAPTAASGSFAYNLNTLMPRDKNYMFSPFSIKAALVLAANGADEETLKEFEDVLQGGDLDKLNSDIQTLTNAYEGLEGTEIKIADSIWLNTDVAQGINFNKNYAANVISLFNTEPRSVNNQNAVSAINSWCSTNTNGKITEIINDPNFIAALVNAVYFNGKWEMQFNKDNTKKSTFTDRNGSKKEIDFMNRTGSYRFYKDSDIKILELPYSDGRLAMYAYMSNDKRMDIANYFDKLDSSEVIVSLPKFRTEYSRKLNDDLKALGLVKSFDKYNANFKRMFENYDPDNNFYINEVLHKTYIDVDEEGTEAAAVTAITMRNLATSVDEKPRPEEFIADKPFGYCIADKETNEILFMGEYAFAE